MKRERLNIQKLLPALLLFLFATTACLDDKYEENGSYGAEKAVTFSLTLPGQSTGRSTYALTTYNEEEVTGVEVLLFVSGNYSQSRKVTAAEISGTGTVKTFTVKIPEGTYSSIVMLANCSDIVASAALSNTDTRAAALAKMKLSNSGKWVTRAGATDYRPIPMWGELENAVVNQANSTSSQSRPLELSLTRMLSKVSVSLTTLQAINNFSLKTIQVYNYYNAGSVAPVANNWGLGVATAASVPTDAAKPAVTTPYTKLTYSGAEITTTNVASTGEIYLFESDNTKQNDQSTRTCLVLGGTWAGDGKIYYYRVDFLANQNGTDRYIDLLRNHHYKLNVTKVNGPGYPTPDEAFSARPFNIEATVIIWNDTEVKNVATDGQYMLGLSQLVYNLAADSYTASESDNKLTIITDYPNGWSISSIKDNATGLFPNWLNLMSTDMSGAANTRKTISLNLAQNNSGAPRSAILSVTAGTLTLEVKVNQSILSNLKLDITDLSNTPLLQLLFYSGLDPAASLQAQSFRVSWSPKSAPNNISVTQSFTGTMLFPFAASGDQITSGAITAPNGLKQYSIIPPAMSAAEVAANPFLEKSSEVKYEVSDGTNTVQKSIFLRQVNYALQTFEKSVYLLNGKTYSFAVKSNAPWQISSVTDQNQLLSLGTSDNLRVNTTGGPNITTGDNLTFTVKNNSASSGVVTVVFISNDNQKRFSSVTVTLNFMGQYYPPAHSGWAGSNIYWDGTKLTFDDVDNKTHSRYQGLYFQWGSLTGQSPIGSYTPNSTIIYPQGAGPTTNNLSWANLPHVSENSQITSNPPNGKTERDRAYLYELDMTDGKGDICKYITENSPGGLLHNKRWRMPTSNEFQSGSSANGTSVTATAKTSEGTATMGFGVTKPNDIGTPFFPAADYRILNGSWYTGTQNHGFYWSSSPSSDMDANYLYGGFYCTFQVNQFSSGRFGSTYGFSVRCVAE